MARVHGGLLEAYIGHYEEEREVLAEYRAMVDREVASTPPDEACAVEDYDSWLKDWCERRILADDRREHLERYLEWNGILGYSHSIWHIATGSD